MGPLDQRYLSEGVEQAERGDLLSAEESEDSSHTAPRSAVMTTRSPARAVTICYPYCMGLLARESAAVDEFCAWVRARFGDRVRALALFGSRARGDGDESSDVDVLVVVDGLTGAERREIAHQSGDAVTNHDVIVAPFALSASRWDELRARERLIAREIERDEVPL